MHFHIEVVIQKREWPDIKRCVAKQMNSAQRELGWDWWIIGGRWSGSHTLAALDPMKLDAFNKECEKRRLFWTSAVDTEEIQRKRTHTLFKEYFPRFKGKIPVYRDQYAEVGANDDVIRVEKCPERLKTFALILPKFGRGTRYNPRRVRVLATEQWNGSDFVATKFKGNVKETLNEYGITVGELVTVDIHS